MGVHKKFSEELYKQNNDVAIARVLEHLMRTSPLFAAVNEDKYGPDIVVFDGLRPSRYVEVEVKRVWSPEADVFPWSTVQLPERKAKFLRKQLSIEFWILRSDLNRVMIIPDYAISSSSLVEVPNSMISGGEKFFQIPIENCIQKEI